MFRNGFIIIWGETKRLKRDLILHLGQGGGLACIETTNQKNIQFNYDHV